MGLPWQERSFNPNQEQELSTAPLRRLEVGADRGSPRPEIQARVRACPASGVKYGTALSPQPARGALLPRLAT